MTKPKSLEEIRNELAEKYIKKITSALGGFSNNLTKSMHSDFCAGFDAALTALAEMEVGSFDEESFKGWWKETDDPRIGRFQSGLRSARWQFEKDRAQLALAKLYLDMEKAFNNALEHQIKLEAELAKYKRVVEEQRKEIVGNIEHNYFLMGKEYLAKDVVDTFNADLEERLK